ncbi:hypothetical protein [Mangrovibacterium diazotrophicum]|uniref:PH (Pleckstrin Homology) domain-containing protein n=1 Tax=Mangrovibacterium diazotrophicum TaxID=1261403 RepID=A0A419W5E7_9BACT|nr:hypothetical protein [Mangrovibacterium diazotrophicum]RKD90656.1 hypothetical protein BC643_0997 [Mangrovibacterium diazotrophicum]
MNTDSILYQTDNLHKPWTWMKRVALFLFVLLAVNLYPGGHFHYEWLRHAIALATVILLLFIPKQEVAVDSVYLYIRDVSLIPFLSRSRKLKLSEIKNIRITGLHKKKAEIMEFLAPGGNVDTSSRLKVTYRDNSTERFCVSVSKADLQSVLKIARQQIKDSTSL